MPIHDELDPASVAPARTSRHTNRGTGPEVSRSLADPGSASHEAVFELQRLAGNAALTGLIGPTAQRASAEGEEDPGAERSPVLDVVGQGGGRPLDVGIRREMEASLGADFSNVRLHTDAAATESARAVNANAYTVGEDVVIRNDRWSPGSDEGRKTIAHELTHVVQQRSGPVSGSDAGGGIRLSDPGDEFEQAAERTAATIVAGGTAAPSPSSGAAPAQLEAEDEAVAQGEFVQREGETAEEEEELEEEGVAQGEFVQREGETAGDEEMEEEEELVTQGEFVQRQGEEELEEEETPVAS